MPSVLLRLLTKVFFSAARPEVEKCIKPADARGGLLDGWKTKLAQEQKTKIAGM